MQNIAIVYDTNTTRPRRNCRISSKKKIPFNRHDRFSREKTKIMISKYQISNETS